MSQENGNYDDGDGDRDSDRDSDCDSDTSEYREMAKQDACFDGSWIYDGHCGMMIGLDSPDFMEIQYEDFVDEKEQDPSLDVKEEFVSLEFVDRESEEDLSRLFQSLRERNLFVTNGVLRRFVEDMAPTRIRICRLHEELELKPMMELKQRGNEMFGKKKYQDAIDLYDEAVVFVADDMYIGPCDHIELIVNVLSNKAECELRLGMYYEAGNTATDALVFMEHEKARIRRAKAGLAIAKKRDEDKLESSVADLLQAKKDLEEVLDPKNDCTLAAKEACQKLMPNIENELNRWKIALLEKRPKLDWDLYVRMIRCNFW